jgi:hypothetical protein
MKKRKELLEELPKIIREGKIMLPKPVVPKQPTGDSVDALAYFMIFKYAKQ